MSKEQLIELLKVQLDEESDSSSRRNRQLNTAKQGNNVFAQNIGSSIFEYLDTIYFERVKDYITETYEERIKKLEDEVKALKAKVK